MISYLRKFRAAFHNTHGWGIELRCSSCNAKAVPRMEGWNSKTALSNGDGATIFAKLTCSGCGRNLINEAGAKLRELFEDASFSEENNRIIRRFIGALVIVPVALALALLLTAFKTGWWLSASAVLILSALSIWPISMLMNYRIALLKRKCECGKPNYIFHGLVGRTGCYRCASCGALMRLRDY